MESDSVKTAASASTETQQRQFSLFTEAILLSILSAITYLMAFRYEEAYLRFFGVSELFVELSIEKIVYVFSALVTLVGVAYMIVKPLPLFAHPKLIFLLNFPLEMVLIFIFFLL